MGGPFTPCGGGKIGARGGTHAAIPPPVFVGIPVVWHTHATGATGGEAAASTTGTRTADAGTAGADLTEATVGIPRNGGPVEPCPIRRPPAAAARGDPTRSPRAAAAHPSESLRRAAASPEPPNL
jgi:hypothetical protein